MSYMAQNSCDKTNTLPKMKNYADLHTLPCMVYSTRNKQRNNDKKSYAKKF